MARESYSLDLAKALRQRIREAGLLAPFRPSRHEEGDVLDLPFTTVWPEVEGRGRFRIERYVGGGFAGQVYRCVVESLDLPAEGAQCGLRAGMRCAVKVMRPASRFATTFRGALYRIGFQAPFSAEVLASASRAGLLWQKAARAGAAIEFDDAAAVTDVFASFFDADIGAHGEIREWVEGRVWRLESDTHPARRRDWRQVDPRATGSPEFVAKRQFMHRFVRLLHAIGAPELARQYEWWTMKSQPNVLKRAGFDGDPARGLCAVDFRAGLVLLPFLPMSPRDVGLIFEGLFRGSLVQFDRGDFGALRRYAAAHPEVFAPLAPMIDALEGYDRAYRRSLPDLSHQGLRLLVDGRLRTDVRRGLAAGYVCAGLASPSFAQRLSDHPLRFAAFWALGCVPLLGNLLRRLWAVPAYRAHWGRLLTDARYFGAVRRVGVWTRLIGWLRAGRCGEARAGWLAERPMMFWLTRLTLGLLPIGLHRALAEPSYALARLSAGWVFVRSFYADADFRERWLTDIVEQSHAEGALDDTARDAILAHARDPFIAKYLKCLAVHFATLPVSEITYAMVSGLAVGVALASGRGWTVAGTWVATAIAAFVSFPISPGSLCRGTYVVFLMVREREVRNYAVAASLSFLKIVGYLAFPIQMAATYPAMAQFLAGRWAEGTVHLVPVFGESGALLEHMVFDLFFNRTRILGARISRHLPVLLTTWMALGLGGLLLAYGLTGGGWGLHATVDRWLLVICAFVLPRMVLYPLLHRRRT